MSKEKGIRYNKGKLRWRNFPKFLFRPVVEVGSWAEKRDGNPNGKYPTLNFLKGLPVQDTLDSLERHLDKLSDPNISDYDEETGLHHLAHVAWNALVALHYVDTEYDDRELRNTETKQSNEEIVDRINTALANQEKLYHVRKAPIMERTAEDKAFEFAEQYNKLNKND